MQIPLFIRALPLSLKTFWRYLILLPFLAVAAFALSLAGMIPVFGLLVPGAVSAGLILMGLRCALAARGHGGELDVGRLMTVSLIFGLIGSVGGFLANMAYRALYLVLSHAGITINPLGIFAGFLHLTPYWTVMSALLSLPYALLVSALTVPATSAAASASHRGPDAGALFGLGTGIFGLCIPFLFSMFAGGLLSFFGEIAAMFALLATALLAMINGTDLPWEWSIDPGSLLGGTLVMTWAASWFYATAVLYWERAMEKDTRTKAGRAEASRVTSTDIRALRQTREQRGVAGQ